MAIFLSNYQKLNLTSSKLQSLQIECLPNFVQALIALLGSAAIMAISHIITEMTTFKPIVALIQQHMEISQKSISKLVMGPTEHEMLTNMLKPSFLTNCAASMFHQLTQDLMQITSGDPLSPSACFV